MFWFIDGLASVNDGGEVEKVYHEICTPDLKLKREKRSDAKLPLLDLDINIVKRIFSLSLYDKRNSFSFPTVNMQYLWSMPPKIFYVSLGDEVLGIAITGKV